MQGSSRSCRPVTLGPLGALGPRTLGGPFHPAVAHGRHATWLDGVAMARRPAGRAGRRSSCKLQAASDHLRHLGLRSTVIAAWPHGSMASTAAHRRAPPRTRLTLTRSTTHSTIYHTLSQLYSLQRPQSTRYHNTTVIIPNSVTSPSLTIHLNHHSLLHAHPSVITLPALHPPHPSASQTSVSPRRLPIPPTRRRRV